MRTDADEVKSILQLDYDTNRNPSLTPYMTAASLIIDRVKVCASAKSKALTETELTILETWLSAHLYQQSDPGYSSRNTGGAGGSFLGQTGMGLDSTRYGQTAKLLDYSGCLTAILEKREVSFEWMGTPPDEALKK